MFILKVAEILTKYKIPYAIVGGYAVALHGAVRGTVDIDFITKWNLSNLKKIEKALAEIGLSPRLPISPEDLFNFKDDYINNKNLIAWNFINKSNPLEQVDVVITTDLSDVKTKKIKVQNKNLTIISKPDLIEMKKKSARAQDLIDAKALEKI